MIGQWFDTFRCEELISLQQSGPGRLNAGSSGGVGWMRHEPLARRPDGVPGTPDRRGPLGRALILLIILVRPAVQKERAQVFQE
jgi:hypothetical protein